MEYVPVVNENDEWLFSARRGAVHDEENPLWHRSVTVLTFQTPERENLLVQRRSADKERKPGHLEFPGGHVESGETYLEAAIREYSEELLDRRPDQTSITADDFTAVQKIDKMSHDNYEKVKVYSTVYDGPFDLSDEVDSVWYEPVDELDDNMARHPDIYTNSTKQSFEEYFESQSNSGFSPVYLKRD